MYALASRTLSCICLSDSSGSAGWTICPGPDGLDSALACRQEENNLEPRNAGIERSPARTDVVAASRILLVRSVCPVRFVGSQHSHKLYRYRGRSVFIRRRHVPAGQRALDAIIYTSSRQKIRGRHRPHFILSDRLLGNLLFRLDLDLIKYELVIVKS